jgi:hypothetical protein
MDYLFGLRLIIALSVIGVAVMVGVKAYSLNEKTEKDIAPRDTTLKNNGSRQLRDDFWSSLTNS